MSSSIAAELPKEHKALVYADWPPQVKTVPVPQPTPGSAVVKVIAANVLSYIKEVLTGVRPYPMPKPLVIGSSAVARVAAAGPDSTAFRPGQLVLVDSCIHSRDDPSTTILHGLLEGMTDSSRKLARGEWRDCTYAEYAKVPLENVHPLDEKKLLGDGLGYKIEDLTSISSLCVPFGGLTAINVMPGDTVVVVPATGNFGGAAVRVALAMGANVIAMGRNVQVLERIQASYEKGRVQTVQMTGNTDKDLASLQAFGTIDAVFDISPPQAAKSGHIKACILALKVEGRLAYMGGIAEDMAFPLQAMMFKSIMVKAKFMYDRQDVSRLIKMVENGVLKLSGGSGGNVTGVFGLDDWEKAMDAAEAGQANGEKALIAP